MPKHTRINRNTIIIEGRVSAENIREGVRCEPSKCMLALFLSDAGVTNPSVGAFACAKVRGGNREYCTGLLPDNVRKKIRDFDRGLPVKPFKVKLTFKRES